MVWATLWLFARTHLEHPSLPVCAALCGCASAVLRAVLSCAQAFLRCCCDACVQPLQLSDACMWPLADALGVDARIDVDTTGSTAPPYLAYNMRCVVYWHLHVLQLSSGWTPLLPLCFTHKTKCTTSSAAVQHSCSIAGVRLHILARARLQCAVVHGSPCSQRQGCHLAPYELWSFAVACRDVHMGRAPCHA